MNRSLRAESASRRGFIRQAMLAGGLAVGASPLARLFARSMESRPVAGFGALRPVIDESTGLPLLALPEGFRYRSFGWAGTRLSDGTLCPGRHDGMGVVAMEGDVVTLVRNQEQTGMDGALGAVACHYDAPCNGGTTTLRYNVASGELVDAWTSLSGTMQNCAGGATPWHTWLSCEEFVVNGGLDDPKTGGRFTRDHGYVFEVPAQGLADPVPLRAMGQFRHEAATVHPASGDVFLTEDLEPSAGFYRFVPRSPGRLAEGGQLFMLGVKGLPDLRRGLTVGERWPVQWVPIDQPDAGFDAARRSISGVHDQGVRAGASRFTRLEGCVAADDSVYFTSTDGGDAASGQVFCYHPSRAELSLVFESRAGAMLHYPDNVCVSPRGGLVICQDSPLGTQALYGLTPEGGLFPFARNDVQLDGFGGFTGDYRRAEWAGACFSPDGRWLFANVYSPGFTVAITGPWQDGLV